MSKAPILLAEDEPEIRHLLRDALRQATWQAVEAGTVKAGLEAAGHTRPALAIVDLGLPDADGKRFIRELRAWSDIPVLVLSARDQERDKIEALDCGADDYLTKPFSTGELLARVRALLRRRPSASQAPRITFGDVEVDLSRRVVTRAGVAVHLTNIEYRLLAVMLVSEGKLLTHRHLLREVWGPHLVDSPHYLRIYVGHLRQKLEEDPARPRHFITETGAGYRFVS